MTDYKTLTCAEVSVGDTLEAVDIDITTGLVVCGALATRDFEPVHHSKAEAQATGLPDVFMNILTSQGLMTRYATDWSGPEAFVNSIDLKLGAPNLPGMVMTMTGEVTAVDASTGRVDITVLGENNIWGMHMQGTVQLTLPQEA
ncbi:MAG: MaoC/PaaZ C-terminal domain-containing protein [Gammaproteobacteria bacterium]|nr:MaoC/PaaZ C-terminal domain-containing protein [Gammaproteobacteria bacterium]